MDDTVGTPSDDIWSRTIGARCEDVADMAKTAIVTGAGGALGGAVARDLAQNGWAVVGVDREDPKLDGVTCVSADLLTPEGARHVADVAGDGLRGLVHCVGGFDAPGLVHEVGIERFERQFALNVRTAYLMAQAALPALRLEGGAIVCVSSRAALQPFPGAAGYITSKSALLSLVDALAVEYRDDGVRVNAVLPSVIDTPANRKAMPGAEFTTWVSPQQIALMIRHLISDDSGVTSGAHIPVYGRA
jgi:NAD(P)-dependent dehydrogenase (short-subunit alcohol dehydrogenase family)